MLVRRDFAPVVKPAVRLSRLPVVAGPQSYLTGCGGLPEMRTSWRTCAMCTHTPPSSPSAARTSSCSKALELVAEMRGHGIHVQRAHLFCPHECLHQGAPSGYPIMQGCSIPLALCTWSYLLAYRARTSQPMSIIGLHVFAAHASDHICLEAGMTPCIQPFNADALWCFIRDDVLEESVHVPDEAMQGRFSCGCRQMSWSLALDVYRQLVREGCTAQPCHLQHPHRCIWQDGELAGSRTGPGRAREGQVCRSGCLETSYRH